MTASREEAVLAFWTTQNVLSSAAARERLDQVVCLLLDGGDRIVGVNSVFERRVALIGDRRFWIYRALLAPGVPDELDRAMAEAAHRALDEEFGAGRDGPIGICVFADATSMRRHPETLWSGTGMLHAGYLPDGRQVRVGYFEGARV